MAQANSPKEDVITVMINDGNRGMHSIVGVRTRINYGMYKTGDMLSMHSVDQRAQPQYYVINQITQPVLDVLPMPTAPVVAESNGRKEMPKPVVVEPSTPIAVPEPQAVESEQSGAEGIDISLMPLNALRNLDWDVESAKDALDAERLSAKPRKNVVAFFEEYLPAL